MDVQELEKQQSHHQCDFYERGVEAMRAAGFKLTPQRAAILDLFCEHFSHFTPQEVFQRLDGSVASLSLATVYNSLEVFEQVGLVRRVCTDQGQTYFDPNVVHHHHAICEKCDAIFDLEIPSQLIDQLLHATTNSSHSGQGFTLQQAHIWFRGICAGCK